MPNSEFNHAEVDGAEAMALLEAMKGIPIQWVENELGKTTASFLSEMRQRKYYREKDIIRVSHDDLFWLRNLRHKLLEKGVL